MIRTQISLTDTQMRRLRQAARERHMSIAAVIREAVDKTIPDEDADRLARQRRAFELAGAFDSGQRDTAERHDEIFSERTSW